MTLYRNTLCGWCDCPNIATHLLRLLVPVHGVPFDARKPFDVLVSVEVCSAHDDKAEFVALIKSAGLVDQVQAFCRARGEVPVDIGRAVVRLIRKDDGDHLQYPSR